MRTYDVKIYFSDEINLRTTITAKNKKEATRDAFRIAYERKASGFTVSPLKRRLGHK